MKLSELYWHRITPLHLLLWPLSIIYRFFKVIKKACYWLDICHTVKLPVPVIVIDSASVNDGGKTTLLLWLMDYLLGQGFSPAIITRDKSGYSGLPGPVAFNNDRRHYGAKTLLLAHHCGKSCPIWTGSDNAATAKAILDANPTCNVILCSDGLQDFRLERDIEVIVVDFNEQSLGNGLLLPAGPLKLSFNSLDHESFIVTNNNSDYLDDFVNRRKTYNMKLFYEIAYQVENPEIQKTIADFRNDRLHAVADVDNFPWLYEVLMKAGIDAEFHTCAENHRFIPEDINFPEADVVLMPEENALQCQDFAHDKLWALPYNAWVNAELQQAILNKLRNVSAQNN